MTKLSGYRSGSISQRHGSADPDPDPHQNIMDPEHCLPGRATYSQAARAGAASQRQFQLLLDRTYSLLIIIITQIMQDQYSREPMPAYDVQCHAIIPIILSDLLAAHS